MIEAHKQWIEKFMDQEGVTDALTRNHILNTIVVRPGLWSWQIRETINQLTWDKHTQHRVVQDSCPYCKAMVL